MGRLIELEKEIKKEQEDYIAGLPFKEGDVISYKMYSHSSRQMGRVRKVYFGPNYDPAGTTKCICMVDPQGFIKTYGTTIDQKSFDSIRVEEEFIPDKATIDRLMIELDEINQSINELTNKKYSLDSQLHICRSKCVHKVEGQGNICIHCGVNVRQQ